MSAVLQGVGGPGWEARICKVGVQFSSQIVPSWVLTQVAESDNGGQGPSAGSGGGNEGPSGLAGAPGPICSRAQVASGGITQRVSLCTGLVHAEADPSLHLRVRIVFCSCLTLHGTQQFYGWFL